MTRKERFANFLYNKRSVVICILVGFLIGLSCFIIIISKAMHTISIDPEPTLSPDDIQALVDFENATIYTADDGEIIIPSAVPLAENPTVFGETPDTIWLSSASSTSNFTLPVDAVMDDGSLGLLTIPAIGLTVNVYEAEAGSEIEAMAHGAAHLPVTSCWDGNVGLAAHNSGVNTYFRQLYQLKTGDIITYQTAQGTRSYRVESTTVIDEYDWSMLARTSTNAITLLTCIDGQPTNRLCVRGEELTE